MHLDKSPHNIRKVPDQTSENERAGFGRLLFHCLLKEQQSGLISTYLSSECDEDQIFEPREMVVLAFFFFVSKMGTANPFLRVLGRKVCVCPVEVM